MATAEESGGALDIEAFLARPGPLLADHRDHPGVPV
jgi:hypothetical protein